LRCGQQLLPALIILPREQESGEVDDLGLLLRRQRFADLNDSPGGSVHGRETSRRRGRWQGDGDRGAALKLIRIGQDGVQRTLRTAGAETARVTAASRTIAREDAGVFNPLLEIAAMRHERAEERLFIS